MAVLLRRIAAAATLALLAVPAEARERASFTVGAQVVHAARVSVTAARARGGVRLEAQVDRGAGRRPARIALGEAAPARGSPLVAAIAPEGGATIVVTVLVDGRPTSF